MILSHAFWRSEFSGRLGVLGQTLQLWGRNPYQSDADPLPLEHRIVGVLMPELRAARTEFEGRFAEVLSEFAMLPGARFDVVAGIVSNADAHRDALRQMRLFLAGSVLLARELAFVQRVQWTATTVFDWRVLGRVVGLMLVLTVLVSLAPIASLRRVGIAAASRSVTARPGWGQHVAGTAQLTVAAVIAASHSVSPAIVTAMVAAGIAGLLLSATLGPARRARNTSPGPLQKEE